MSGGTAAREPRVAVVIATYDTGEAFGQVVAALDAQTLDPADYEVVVVDDGSPDPGFWELLQGVVAERPHWQLERIERSGGPGRPRNVGVERARARYVFFMDHDDHVFPEALQRMADLADEHGCDVVHPKEVVRGWRTPGWFSWPSSTGRLELDQATLQCITVHKLYRRQFLLDHAITFPEGRVRLEDYDYNAQVWTRTDRIGVLADYPCYRWEQHAGTSEKAGADPELYWQSFERSLQHVVGALAPGAKQDQLLVRWYRSRILEVVAGFRDFSDARRAAAMTRFARLLGYFPTHLDALLTPADRARSRLLRAGDGEALVRLSEADSAVRLRARRTRARWRDGRLVLEVAATLEVAAGEPMAFRVEEGRVLRDLGAVDLPDDASVDLAADLGSVRGLLVVRSREEVVDWPLETTSHVTLVPGADGRSHLSLRLSAELDPLTAAGGRPLDEDAWDLFFRWDGLGWTGSTWVPAEGVPVSTALVSGRLLVCYPTKPGNLALDAGQRVRTLVGSSQPRWTDRREEANRTVLPLPAVHVAGTDTSVPGVLELDRQQVGAELRTVAGAAELLVDVPAAQIRAASSVRAVVLGARSAELLPDRAGQPEPAEQPSGKAPAAPGREVPAPRRSPSSTVARAAGALVPAVRGALGKRGPRHPAVTIGIPTYNAAELLARCLDSVLAQTVPLSTIEVVVVDDGSTDHTPQVLTDYARRFPTGGFRVITQAGTGGPATGRNRVIDEARGEFIYFVDSDDYLGPAAVQKMLQLASATTDVVVGQYVGVNRGVPRFLFRTTRPSTSFFETSLVDSLSVLKMFRTSMVRALSYRFDPTLKMAEDHPFCLNAYLHARSVAVLSGVECYFWVRHLDPDRTRLHLTGHVLPVEEYYRYYDASFAVIEGADLPAGQRRAAAARYWDRLLSFDVVTEFRRPREHEDRIASVRRLQEILAAHGDDEVRALTRRDTTVRMTQLAAEDPEVFLGAMDLGLGVESS